MQSERRAGELGSRAALTCPVCGNELFMHNSRCLHCGTSVGYRFDTEAMDVESVPPSEGGRRCANAVVAECNWLVPHDDGSDLCPSCQFTVVRPNDAVLGPDSAFGRAEAAKRRVLAQLAAIGVRLTNRTRDPEHGLGFAFLLSHTEPVVTGHHDGVVTIDLAEADDAHRERIRRELGENYRTVLGHIRHELGHYLWPALVGSSADRLESFRALFGDERADYEAARVDWYEGRRPVLGDDRVSAYAHMHPHEDWAESFGHYLLVDDGLATASRLGISRSGPGGLAGSIALDAAIDEWGRVSVALNEVARATGHSDLYPFVITDGVLRRLEFVHACIAEHRGAVPGGRWS